MPSTSDQYYPRIAVAALDILGFSKLVEKGDESLVAMDTIAKFVRNASSSRLYSDPILGGNDDYMFRASVYFGDSVYLFGDPMRELDDQVAGLCMRVATLLFAGLLEPRLLVRGAIAVGDLRIRSVQGDGESHKIRIGTSMTRAHKLENAQEWIGAAVDRRAPRNDIANGWTACYEVPLKPNSKMRSPVALNWIAVAVRLKLLGTFERLSIKLVVAKMRAQSSPTPYGSYNGLSKRSVWPRLGNPKEEISAK